MNNKPILIVLGEPNSVFSELLFKVFKNKINKKLNRPLLIIGSEKLFKAQMKALKYFLNIRKIKFSDNAKLNNKNINIIDVKYNFKKAFDKISNKSEKYINNCFKIALELLKKEQAFGLINGPISKTHFLKKKYLGITEYLSKKSNIDSLVVKLIKVKLQARKKSTDSSHIIKELDSIIHDLVTDEQFQKNRHKYLDKDLLWIYENSRKNLIE